MVTASWRDDFESGLLSFSGGTLVASSEGIELGSGCQVLEELENNKKITNIARSQVSEELEKNQKTTNNDLLRGLQLLEALESVEQAEAAGSTEEHGAEAVRPGDHDVVDLATDSLRI